MKYKGVVLITGASVREAKKIFKNTQKEDLIQYEGKLFKINAAVGAAMVLNSNGYLVYLLGSSDEKLKIATSALRGQFYSGNVNLNNLYDLNKLKEEIERIKIKSDVNLHIVHYGSASDTKIPLPGNSIFLTPWETPPKALAEIVEANVVPWLNLLQVFKPVLVKQNITKIITITAIAATRSLPVGILDNVQKGAVHSMARSLALDLTKEKIFVTEIMPGITDTGFYDNEFILERSMAQDKEFGYEYKKEDLPAFSGKKVGEAVYFAIDTQAHIREISLIPYGQFPHLGS